MGFSLEFSVRNQPLLGTPMTMDLPMEHGCAVQVHRLQNRVLLLQRELELLRGPRGRGAQEPMVPEKQFQQLTTAHAKVGT